MSENKYKVGDELAFRCGSNSSRRWEIHKIEKITPSGRMRCGRWELNPDLTLRSRYDYSCPHKAEPVTSAIRKGIQREKSIQTIKDTTWSKLTDDQLFDVMKIIGTIVASSGSSDA